MAHKLFINSNDENGNSFNIFHNIESYENLSWTEYGKVSNCIHRAATVIAHQAPTNICHLMSSIKIRMFTTTTQKPFLKLNRRLQHRCHKIVSASLIGESLGGLVDGFEFSSAYNRESFKWILSDIWNIWPCQREFDVIFHVEIPVFV